MHSPVNDITTYEVRRPDNLKAFHDEILNGGAMPLDLLQERIENWIKDRKLNGATGASDMAGKAAR